MGLNMMFHKSIYSEARLTAYPSYATGTRYMKITFLKQIGTAPLTYFVNLAHRNTPLSNVYSEFPKTL